MTAETNDTLRQEYTIETPENVSLRYGVAGVGSRFIGALIDTLILGALLALLTLAVIVALDVTGEVDRLLGSGSEWGWASNLLMALYALVNFALIWGYYIAFELLWNGQTPGKRAARTRVVRADGEPAGFAEVAVRNLVRIVDFLPVAYAVGLVTMFFDSRARRLGDFAAGTMVVRDDAAIQLATLGVARIHTHAPAPPPAAPDLPVSLLDADIRRLTHADVTLIRQALDRELNGKLPFATLRRLAEVLAAKVAAPLPADERVATRRFLIDLTEAYEQRGRA